MVPDADPNAFATGRGPEHASIAVTRGLLDTLDRDELQGVIAHEMSHIRNFDVRLMTIVAALVGGVALLSDWAWRASFRGGFRRRDENRRDSGGSALAPLFMVLWVVTIILAPLISRALAMMVSRGRESLADASAAELTRNPIGLAWLPGTRKMWAAVQERDRLGDDLAPDYVTEIKEGGFYGWPYAYAGAIEDPRHKGERPDLVKKTITGDVLIQAHSAILGLTFYEGKMFPKEYRGDVFVALHGSWNRTKRTGYKIIRIRLRDGVPTGEYEDFVTGFVVNDSDVWGRPVGVAVARDGALLLSEDGNGTIWRITHQ